MPAIQNAVEILGSQSALAASIGVSPSFVNQLVNGLRPVPPKLCRRIEVATAGKVTRKQLRPDIFCETPA